eukprot:TRINITY_DN1364_c0_g1_i1.p1 TRINITY_DN1364_c0_g1~~TRINITY_DN1364_c0_g1_i1.p1  ORF type:complete len:423 (-),score=91.76 TRINITY_DN1364_c0_g1_i1:30-1298(-)
MAAELPVGINPTSSTPSRTKLGRFEVLEEIATSPTGEAPPPPSLSGSPKSIHASSKSNPFSTPQPVAAPLPAAKGALSSVPTNDLAEAYQAIAQPSPLWRANDVLVGRKRSATADGNRTGDLRSPPQKHSTASDFSAPAAAAPSAAKMLTKKPSGAESEQSLRFPPSPAWSDHETPMVATSAPSMGMKPLDEATAAASSGASSSIPRLNSTGTAKFRKGRFQVEVYLGGADDMDGLSSITNSDHEADHEVNYDSDLTSASIATQRGGVITAAGGGITGPSSPVITTFHHQQLSAGNSSAIGTTGTNALNIAKTAAPNLDSPPSRGIMPPTRQRAAHDQLSRHRKHHHHHSRAISHHQQAAGGKMGGAVGAIVANALEVVEAIQYQLRSTLEENEKIRLENEALEKEIEQLRAALAARSMKTF